MRWALRPPHIGLLIALSIAFLPSAALAADLHSLTSIQVGGAQISDGSTVTRNDFSSISQFWRFNFTWPNSVSSSRSIFAIFRGTFGSVAGGTVKPGTNYSSQADPISAGANSVTKQFSLPPDLGSLAHGPEVYTAVVAELNQTPSMYSDFPLWFQSAGMQGVEPLQYSTLTFTYEPTSIPVYLPDAVQSVIVAGREVFDGEAVYRKELFALNGSTDQYWRFNFSWPNAVTNQQTLFMVFKGTFGNIEGGSPLENVNYGHNSQIWPSGENDIAKFIGLPALQHSSTTSSIYTVMIAERDPKFLAEGVDEQALWFSSGGVQGIGPLKYSLLTFEFKADEPYPVVIVPGILGSAQNGNGEWVLDPITHIYDNLYDTLDVNWYTPEKDLFTFPYDWRKSNVDTAFYLRDKIDEVQEICRCRKVDLVAHSMGGLVSRQYIQSDYYEDDVNKMIFLGTPHLGAPKAYLMWEAGETEGGGFNFLFQLFLEQLAAENGYNSAFEYVRQHPIDSTQELLPVYSYLFEQSTLRVYPLSYPRNEFLERLRDSTLLLIERVVVTNFIGDNQSDNTITSLNVVQYSDNLELWEHGIPEQINRGIGDETVPYLSSAGLTVTQEFLSSHSQLPGIAQSEVFRILTGYIPESIVNLSLPERFLTFRIFSPADLLITDPQGRRIGREGSGVINEIPGAYYTGFNTNTEFIVILDPLDGEYQVRALGVDGGGEYKIATNFIAEDVNVEDSYEGSVGHGESNELVAELDSSSQLPIEIHSPDDEHPTIVISSPTVKDYLHSAILSLDFKVGDTGSGIANTTVTLDGNPIMGPVDLFFKPLGDHIFSVFADDVSGNATSSNVHFRVVTTPEDTILDISRSYDLGWITKTQVRNSLIQMVRKATKIVKKIEYAYETLPDGTNKRKRIEKLETRFDKLLGRRILSELEKLFEKGSITQQAYDILRADVEWILGDL